VTLWAVQVTEDSSKSVIPVASVFEGIKHIKSAHESYSFEGTSMVVSLVIWPGSENDHKQQLAEVKHARAN